MLNVKEITVEIEFPDIICATCLDGGGEVVDECYYVPERTCHDVSKSGVFFECSNCGAIEVDGGTGNYTLNYCPNCGSEVVD